MHTILAGQASVQLGEPMVHGRLRIDENRAMTFGHTLGRGREFLDLGAHGILWVRLEHERTHDDDPLKIRCILFHAFNKLIIDTLVSFHGVEASLPQRTIEIAPGVIHADHDGHIVRIHVDDVTLPAFGHVDDIVAVDAFVDGAQCLIRIYGRKKIMQCVDIPMPISPASGDSSTVAVGVRDGIAYENNA